VLPLKKELIHRQSWTTKAQVRPAASDLFEEGEVVDHPHIMNRRRPHSSLDYLSLAEYESRFQIGRRPFGRGPI
jgi:transposase InsO family protein